MPIISIAFMAPPGRRIIAGKCGAGKQTLWSEIRNGGLDPVRGAQFPRHCRGAVALVVQEDEVATDEFQRSSTFWFGCLMSAQGLQPFPFYSFSALLLVTSKLTIANFGVAESPADSSAEPMPML
jgi:hypothetical protein